MHAAAAAAMDAADTALGNLINYDNRKILHCAIVENVTNVCAKFNDDRL